MKKYLYIYLLFCAVQAGAQQLPQYSNYMVNGYAINPAIGGSNPYFEAKCDARYQWVGINDAPRTYILNVNGPTKSLKMGLGGMIFSDVTGPTRRTGFYLSYAYHLKLTEKIKASFGVSAGVVQYVVDGTKISMHDSDDPTIGIGQQTLIAPDFGAGVYVYSTDKKWYVGASVPQVSQSKVKFYDRVTASTSRLNAHSFLIGAYNFNLNESFKIEPSVCLKYIDPVPLQFDLGVRAIYNDKYWIGAVYRYMDAASVIVGLNIKENISIAYSYDYTLTSIKKYITGTHELMIGIRFHKVDNTE